MGYAIEQLMNLRCSSRDDLPAWDIRKLDSLKHLQCVTDFFAHISKIKTEAYPTPNNTYSNDLV